MLAIAEKLGVRGETRPQPSATSSTYQQFESLAQDLLFAFESGVPVSMDRLKEHYRRNFSWDELRTAVKRRLDEVPESERLEGYFALPHARLLVAREAGFRNWKELEDTHAGIRI